MDIQERNLILTRRRWLVLFASCAANLALGAFFAWSVFAGPMAEKLNALQWGSIGICFMGVVLLCVLNGGFSANLGLMWLSCCILLMSTFNLLQKKLSASYPSLSITAYSFMFGGIGMLFFLPKAVPPPLADESAGCPAPFCPFPVHPAPP